MVQQDIGWEGVLFGNSLVPYLWGMAWDHCWAQLSFIWTRYVQEVPEFCPLFYREYCCGMPDLISNLAKGLKLRGLHFCVDKPIM